MISSCCCHPSSNHYVKLQASSALAATILTSASFATAFIPSVLAITTMALPIALGVGAVIAWVVFIALTIWRCRSSSKDEPIFNKNNNIPQSAFSEDHDKFLNSINDLKMHTDYESLITAAQFARFAAEESAKNVTDQEIISAIRDNFYFEINELRSIAEALRIAAKETPKVVKESLWLKIKNLYSKVKRQDHVTERDIKEFRQLLDTIVNTMGNIDYPMNNLGDNALIMLARAGGPIEFVDILWQKKADFNYKDSTFGNTPLIWAIANAQNEMALKIIQIEEQNFDAMDNTHGNTALLLAIAKGYTTHNADNVKLRVSNAQLVQGLLAAGANPNVKDNMGTSPLKMAVIRRDVQMIKDLLVKGAKVDFDIQEVLNFNYEQASTLLKNQATVYLLNRQTFDESKQKVNELLSTVPV